MGNFFAEAQIVKKKVFVNITQTENLFLHRCRVGNVCVWCVCVFFHMCSDCSVVFHKSILKKVASLGIHTTQYSYHDHMQIADIVKCFRPYAFSYSSWGILYYRQSLVLEKVGIPSLKNQYFHVFEYQKNRAVSKVLWVFETLTNINFNLGKFHFF